MSAPIVRTVSLTALLAACCLTAQAQSPPSSPKESPARAQIEQFVRETGADVSVAFRSLDRTQELFIKEDVGFPATTSAIDVPIMQELYAEAAARELNLTDTTIIHNNFPGGLPAYFDELDRQTDPDSQLYQLLGKPMTLRDLCEHMVARKSNLAAALLIERLGAQRVQRRIEALNTEAARLGQKADTGHAKNPSAEDLSRRREACLNCFGRWRRVRKPATRLVRI